MEPICFKVVSKAKADTFLGLPIRFKNYFISNRFTTFHGLSLYSMKGCAPYQTTYPKGQNQFPLVKTCLLYYPDYTCDTKRHDYHTKST